MSIYFKNVEDINFKKKKLLLKEINNNLKNLKIKNILDTKFYNNKLYISYKKIINNSCNSVGVANADFNFKKLKFTELFFLDECATGAIWGGAIDIYKSKYATGLLLSTSDVVRSNDEDTSKDKDSRPQDNDSLYHKILYYDFEKSKIEIFSKGHRNPGSILVNQKTIISTEHGPRGGDEINLIKKNGNYGWPISSYGDLYFTRQKNPFYKKSHEKFGYIEPVFSYVPSIGISTIIKVPENFSKFWRDNYLIASLYGNSLYRIKFDSGYNKILFSEKIFLGERIRDIKFHENDLIILTFERGLDLGILKKKK
jgi:glucose/arabinose dehydrogenase